MKFKFQPGDFLDYVPDKMTRRFKGRGNWYPAPDQSENKPLIILKCIEYPDEPELNRYMVWLVREDNVVTYSTNIIEHYYEKVKK